MKVMTYCIFAIISFIAFSIPTQVFSEEPDKKNGVEHYDKNLGWIYIDDDALTDDDLLLFLLHPDAKKTENYDFILERNPTHPVTMTIKADFLNKFEEYEQAIVWYDKALEVEPTFVTALDGKDTALSNLKSDAENGGGCLIATAAYGSELAPQVQFLREIRDNTVMSTSSGTAFMTGFNQFYYSFSPQIADLERENPMFQEGVRVFIAPMISTLSIMTLAENDSEAEVLGLGISVIALNIGMYIAAPALVGFAVTKRLKSRK